MFWLQSVAIENDVYNATLMLPCRLPAFRRWNTIDYILTLEHLPGSDVITKYRQFIHFNRLNASSTVYAQDINLAATEKMIGMLQREFDNYCYQVTMQDFTLAAITLKHSLMTDTMNS